MAIHSSTHKTYGKTEDRQKEKRMERHKPRKTITDRKDTLHKLVNLDPEDEASFMDILKPEEAKAVEKIDDKSIWWAQIMRVIVTYNNNNDLGVFINSVEILEATLGDNVSAKYVAEVRKISKKKSQRSENEIKDVDGGYINKFAVIHIERRFWLDKYRAIINELTRKGLWSLKGH